MADETNKPIAFDDSPLVISYADAGDSAKWRMARARATAEGRQLVIEPRPAPAPRTPVKGEVAIPKDATPAEYRALKDAAEKKGVPYRVAD